MKAQKSGKTAVDSNFNNSPAIDTMKRLRARFFKSIEGSVHTSLGAQRLENAGLALFQGCCGIYRAAWRLTHGGPGAAQLRNPHLPLPRLPLQCRYEQWCGLIPGKCRMADELRTSGRSAPAPRRPS